MEQRQLRLLQKNPDLLTVIDNGGDMWDNTSAQINRLNKL